MIMILILGTFVFSLFPTITIVKRTWDIFPHIQKKSSNKINFLTLIKTAKTRVCSIIAAIIS